MGLVGTFFQCFFGIIAGVLRLGPLLLMEFLFGKGTSKYDNGESTEKQLSTTVLDKTNGRIKVSDYKDVFITAKDGTRLHAVVDAGNRRVKGKRPIVFVHGFPELWISWLDQLEDYAKKGHPVLALNMRGYGLSDKPKGEGLEAYHMFDVLVDDIRLAVNYARKMDENSDLLPLLAAHDWGASICWAYVTQGQTTLPGKEEIAGYVSLTIPPGECFEANMGLKQFWASMYIIFFNMPWLPEFMFLMNNAWMIGIMMNAVKQANIPAWMINSYRTNCLQPGAMTAQLNYYRSLVRDAPKADPADVLGPKKGQTSGTPTKDRLLELPVLMIRGKDDGALTEDVFVGYDRYLANAHLVALDNCSHWVQADCPSEVISEMDKLLTEISK